MRRTESPAFSSSSLTSAASARLYFSSGVPLAAMTPGFSGKCPASMATSGPAIETGAAAAQIITALTPNSKTREVRLALLEERAHRLFRLGRVEALAEDPGFLGDLLAHRGRVRRFHQALGQP